MRVRAIAIFRLNGAEAASRPNGNYDLKIVFLFIHLVSRLHLSSHSNAFQIVRQNNVLHYI